MRRRRRNPYWCKGISRDSCSEEEEESSLVQRALFRLYEALSGEQNNSAANHADNVVLRSEGDGASRHPSTYSRISSPSNGYVGSNDSNFRNRRHPQESRALMVARSNQCVKIVLRAPCGGPCLYEEDCPAWYRSTVREGLVPC